MTQRTWFITGVTSGFGRHMTERWSLMRVIRLTSWNNGARSSRRHRGISPVTSSSARVARDSQRSRT